MDTAHACGNARLCSLCVLCGELFWANAMTHFGFYNINKPAGPTSHDIVAGVRRRLREETGLEIKVGHAGTLDPFAGGVLVVAVGPATRLADYVQAAPKRYTAEVMFGATSTTDDVEGDITPAAVAAPPTREQVHAALDEFVGTIMQRPPAYSAVHVDGRRAYKLARDGRPVDVPARSVTIHGLELLRYEYPTAELHVLCGTGTYIRSLARDLGEALGVGGYCSALVRTAVGEFTIDRAVAVEELDLTGDLISPLTALADMPALAVPPELLTPLTQGKTLAVAELAVVAAGPDEAPAAEGGGEVTLVDEAGRLLAIGELAADGRAVHPRKVFVRT